jgi:hypothetical protein
VKADYKNKQARQPLRHLDLYRNSVKGLKVAESGTAYSRITMRSCRQADVPLLAVLGPIGYTRFKTLPGFRLVRIPQQWRSADRSEMINA